LTVAGSAHLVGEDFDRALFDLVDASIPGALSDLAPRVQSRLMEHARNVKEAIHPNTRRLFFEIGGQLSDTERTSLGLEPDAVIHLASEDYERRCRPLVERTLAELDRVSAGRAEELAGVYVVGGASQLPVVARTLRERFGRRVHRSAHPSGSVAMGLAAALDEQSEYELSDQLSRHFGVFREADGGRDVRFDSILSPDFVLPPRAGEERVIEREYHPAHNIGHFRFIECTRVDVTGTPSGDITGFAQVSFPFSRSLQEEQADLRAIGVQRTEENGGVVVERYAVDHAGIVTLTIQDRVTGYSQQHRFLARATG
jgi:hypothetical protein